MGFEYGNALGDNTFTVHIDKVLQEPNNPRFIRTMALILNSREYCTVGALMEMLTVEEVEEMFIIANAIHEGNADEKQTRDIMLGALLMLHAEGELVDSEKVVNYISAACTIVAVEHLGRKGLCEVYRKNYSIVDGHLPIAKRINKE